MIIKWKCYNCKEENLHNLESTIVRCSTCFKFSSIAHSLPASAVLELIPGKFVDAKGWKEKKKK